MVCVAGYDTGVISGALVTINGDLGPAELATGQKVCFFCIAHSVVFWHQVGHSMVLRWMIAQRFSWGQNSSN